MKAMVVGGGIGGACAAIALRRAGIDATVYEQAPAPPEVGAGVSIWGNAVKALARAGAADDVIDAGEVMRYGELRSWRGRVLSETRVDQADRALGAPSLFLHRAELLDALLRNLAPGTVRYAHRFVSLAQDPSGVTAAYARPDGSTAEARADILIGADGLHSAVRARLHVTRAPRYSGYTCWRGVANFTYPLWGPGYCCEAWGRGKRFGLTRLKGRRIYWFATRNSPPGGADTNAKGTLRELFHDWFDPVPDLLEATDAGAIIRTDICDRPPLPRRKPWGQGRVTLLGDAAHPTTPNMGQGACMAIEDTVVLARRLADLAPAASAEAIAGALRAYENQRRARTSMITRNSWRMGRLGQLSSPLVCWVRDLILSLTPRSAIMRSHRQVVGFEA